jgi:peptidoglycan/LPS O-acetylase OafA/YrhL
VALRRRALDGRDADGAAQRIARLGGITSLVGAGLTLAGVVGIVLLVADADSTLFLYTDRAVVAVVGLIVLVPAIVLIALGRALVLISSEFDTSRNERGDA